MRRLPNAKDNLPVARLGIEIWPNYGTGQTSPDAIPQLEIFGARRVSFARPAPIRRPIFLPLGQFADRTFVRFSFIFAVVVRGAFLSLLRQGYLPRRGRPEYYQYQERGYIPGMDQYPKYRPV